MADDRSASMLETMAIDAPHGHYDVAVLGGGLAGLTIAIQLKRERPETRVLVTDKRSEPAPEAAFKVGESSVEIGAYYYREMIGMRDHLEKYQQRKLGLRFFMPAGDNSDITKRVEFCTPGHLDAFTHQIDRGRFENELFRRAKKAGADAFRGWRVQDVSLGADRHTILMSQEDEECIATARWVVDASGRANILRRKVGSGCRRRYRPSLQRGMDPARRRHGLRGLDRRRGVARPDAREGPADPLHFALDSARVLAVADSARVGADLDRRVRRSALPSVGGDQQLRGIDGLDEAQRAAAARRDRRPARGRARLPARPGLLVRVDAVLLADRWTLVGEAGGFLDALYSPGSDFIGFSNTFSCELIERELDGEDVTELAEFYNDFYLNLFNTTAHLYRDNYPAVRQPAGDGPEVRVRLLDVLRRASGTRGVTSGCASPRTSSAWRGSCTRRSRWCPGCNSCSATGTRSSRRHSRACRSCATSSRRTSRRRPRWRVRPRATRRSRSRPGTSVPQCARGLDLPPGRPEPPRAAGREPGDQLAGDQPASRAVGGRRPVLR